MSLHWEPLLSGSNWNNAKRCITGARARIWLVDSMPTPLVPNNGKKPDAMTSVEICRKVLECLQIVLFIKGIATHLYVHDIRTPSENSQESARFSYVESSFLFDFKPS